MKTHKSTSQRKEKKGEEKRRDNKKLRKQEQRLQERLQKAQEEQTQAQKRLERAEARLQKRITQVQCLEESLAQVHERLGIGAEIESGITSALAVQPEPSSVSLNEEPLSIPSADTTPDDSSITVVSLFSTQTSEDIPVIEEVAVEAASVPLESQPPPAIEIISPAVPTQPSSDTTQRAWQARAVAEAAEEEARAAVERMHEVSQRLEEGGVSGRHLEQELAELEEEVERTNSLAEEARRTAQETERETGELLKLDERSLIQEDEEKGREALTAWQEKAWGVEEIAEEEEQLEADVTRTLAEAAAEAAAQAEALAEASSARTRKARIFARQADQELTLVRAAIRNGSLTGKEAQTALQAAEDKSTHAHAELADAEATEESAVDAARNAEADAEVAEGMALSASDYYVNEVNGQAIANQEKRQRTILTQQEAQNGESEEDAERTEERPAIRPQGSA